VHSIRRALGSTLGLGFVALLGWAASRDRGRQQGAARGAPDRDAELRGRGAEARPPPAAPQAAPSGADDELPAPSPVIPLASAAAAEPSDAELVERVRREVAIPWDVEVVAQDGAVVLFGRVPRYLADDLTARVARVDGVQAVVDRLTPVDLVAPERPEGPPDPP
jgi:hypothetical protein